MSSEKINKGKRCNCTVTTSYSKAIIVLFCFFLFSTQALLIVKIVANESNINENIFNCK